MNSISAENSKSVYFSSVRGLLLAPEATTGTKSRLFANTLRAVAIGDFPANSDAAGVAAAIVLPRGGIAARDGDDRRCPCAPRGARSSRATRSCGGDAARRGKTLFPAELNGSGAARRGRAEALAGARRGAGCSQDTPRTTGHWRRCASVGPGTVVCVRRAGFVFRSHRKRRPEPPRAKSLGNADPAGKASARMTRCGSRHPRELGGSHAFTSTLPRAACAGTPSPESS